jgi:hypothetical protein
MTHAKTPRHQDRKDVTLTFPSAMGKTTADPISALGAKLSLDDNPVGRPDRKSFKEFLLNDARVPDGKGERVSYSFEGREALIAIVELADRIIKEKLKDSTVSLAGGAQFGKTVMELNFLAYMTGQRFQNTILYLPDDDLVEGIVDTKFRPDVLDQIEWFAAMTQVGKALNKSGKAVNRKGAILVTDGKRTSSGMIRGLGKVPTSFSADAAAMDEVDDIKPKMAKFVKGRMTASDLRFTFQIGTQRVAGRGMNKAWKEGSQGVVFLECRCGKRHNPEESFPGIIRCAVGANQVASRNDPKLTWTGDFRRDGSEDVVAVHDPTHFYYLACPECGTPLNRRQPVWEHRRPEQMRLRNWSFRISQLSIDAIDLSQIVAHWAKAVVDPEEMVVFRCDRLGLPESTSQKLSPEILSRARTTEIYDMAPKVRPGCTAFAGLDTGRRCWFFAREVERPDVKRVLHAEQIALGNVVERTFNLYHLLGIQVLFIDQAPATDEARTLALKLNGLENITDWPKPPKGKDEWLTLPAGPFDSEPLQWDGTNQRWLNLRCAVVSFTKKKLGAGIAHSFDVFEKGPYTVFVPLIECNRFETIDRVVREFLTPKENVSDVVFPAQGAPYIRNEPAMRLPRKVTGSSAVLELLDTHLLVGSEREDEDDGTQGDYVDGCENHFLLADGYSGLAETIGGRPNLVSPGRFHVFDRNRVSKVMTRRKERSVLG